MGTKHRIIFIFRSRGKNNETHTKNDKYFIKCKRKTKENMENKKVKRKNIKT